MTIKELLKELKDIDEDVLNKDISIVINKQLTNSILITIQGIILEVSEHTDTEGRLIIKVG